MAYQKYSCEDVIEALRRTNGNQAASAKVLGCHRNTVQNYIDRYPTVRAEYEAQRETRLDLAEQEMTKLINDGYWPAIRFLLERQGKHRGYTEKHELDVHLERELNEALDKLQKVLQPDDYRNVLAALSDGAIGETEA